MDLVADAMELPGFDTVERADLFDAHLFLQRIQVVYEAGAFSGCHTGGSGVW